MAPNFDPPSSAYVPATQRNLQVIEDMDSIGKLGGVESWDEHRLADFFEEEGLGIYRELIVRHRINGRVASQLTDMDLKDMHINIIGDRCRFRHLLSSLKRKTRANQRNKLIWSGNERVFFDSCERFFGTCFFLCPENPSTYKLTNSHLKIKTVDPIRFGPFRLCCCTEYKVNNIDLTQVNDIDMEGSPAPFIQECLCCANGKEILEISTDEEEVKIILEAGEGDNISSLIMTQVEECQMMERGL
jgi:hypothetical protein